MSNMYSQPPIHISEENMKEIKEAVATIMRNLPFLRSLTAEEKRILYKLGAKSIDFVQDATTVAQTYPEILPPNFETESLTSNATIYGQLTEIQILLSGLTEKLNDTTALVGSEALKSSLQVYRYVKVSTNTQAGLKNIADMLQQRFKNQGKRTKKTK
jgi:hypothetical protein